MIEIEGGRLEKDSILTGDSGIASGIVALAAYARGLGLSFKKNFYKEFAFFILYQQCQPVHRHH